MDWKLWFAWRPVKLINGRWTWWRDVEWKRVSEIRAHGRGVYTVHVPAYRIPWDEWNREFSKLHSNLG